MQPHTTFDDNGQPLAYVYPALTEDVQLVMEAKEGDPDGRSEWAWVRLANGDLFLGVFPHGDTYLAVSEGNAKTPYDLCKGQW
jgi:hypothetical protein